MTEREPVSIIEQHAGDAVKHMTDGIAAGVDTPTGKRHLELAQYSLDALFRCVRKRTESQLWIGLQDTLRKMRALSLEN